MSLALLAKKVLRSRLPKAAIQEDGSLPSGLLKLLRSAMMFSLHRP